MKNIDDIQRASIRRSEAYLRKKALERAQPGVIREFIAGAMFALLMVMLAIVVLAL